MLNRNSIYVYRNLHTGTWSIRMRQTGLISGHPPLVCLRHATFRVGKTGREKVRRLGVKHVHAGVAGQRTPNSRKRPDGKPVSITYDPYKYETFVDKINGTPVYTAEHVVMDINSDDKILAWGINKETNNE